MLLFNSMELWKSSPELNGENRTSLNVCSYINVCVCNLTGISAQAQNSRGITTMRLAVFRESCSTATVVLQNAVADFFRAFNNTVSCVNAMFIMVLTNNYLLFLCKLFHPVVK